MIGIVCLLTWTGSTLLLDRLPRARRRPLVERIAPHLPGRAWRPSEPGLRAELHRRAADVAAAVDRVLDGRDSTAVRLARAGREESPADLRARQIGRATAVALGCAVGGAAIGVPPVATLAASLGAAMLTTLLVEDALLRAGRRRQDRLRRELPVVEEQLSMLLAAGWSIGGALGRIAARANGAVAHDLVAVRRSVAAGGDRDEALARWAAAADVAAVDRLVRILALDRHGSDLARLLSAEARSTRLEVHRATVEELERRTQLVWIPVTVAALLPGVLLLAVPFLEAMRLFTG